METAFEEYKELYEYLNQQVCNDNKAFAYLYPSCENLPENQRTVYNLLYIISSFQESDDTPGSFSKTACNINGKQFAITDFNESDIILLKNLDYEKMPIALAAKSFAILWLASNDFQYANKAAEYYMKAFEEWFDPNEWLNCIDAFKHSLYYAKKINNKNFVNNALSSLYTHLIAVDGTDSLFFTIESINLLLENKYSDDTKKSVYLKILDKFIIAQTTDIGIDVSKVDRVEEAYTLKSKILKKMNKNKESKNCMIEYANFLVKLFENPSDIRFIFIGENYLKKAVSLFRNNNKPDLATETHRKLLVIQEEKSKHLSTFSKTFDVSKEYNLIQETFNSLSFQEALAWLSMITIFNSKEKVKKRVIDNIKNFPFINFFSQSVMNSKGQTVFNLPPLDIVNPEKDEELLLKHMFMEATRHNQIAGNTHLKFALDYIRQNYEFEETDLDFIFDEPILIPKSRIQIWKKGIYLGLKGDVYSALHLLCPQIEHYFKFIAELCGDIIVTLEDDGTSKSKVLSSVFELPKLNECYDEDILFTFRGLLNENTGANLRNLVAHGIIEENDVISGIGNTLVCMALKLIVFNSSNVINIIHNSEQIQKNIRKT